MAGFVTKKALYFVTGSSGSGKTTLLKGVMARGYHGLEAYHFDELGLPSLEEMNRLYGGPEQWQAHNAGKWISRAAGEMGPGLIVLEGQVRPTVILDAASAAGFRAVHVTLIDCSHEERRRRLITDRGQPELDRLDMYAWAAYLRGQADALGLEVIETTTLSLAEAIEQLARSMERFAMEAGISVR